MPRFTETTESSASKLGDPDQTPLSVSYLGLHCWPVSNDLDSRLIFNLVRYILRFLQANSGDPNQMPRCVSNLGLHCLPRLIVARYMLKCLQANCRDPDHYTIIILK